VNSTGEVEMRTVSKILGAIAVLLITASPASAIPTLQLDISGGTYVPEAPRAGQPGGTTYANADSFTLYGYLVADDNNTLTDTYYISAAVVPKVDESANLGSFTYDAELVNVTGSMTYGTPPVETYTGTPDWDLAGHGIFPTYYKEFEVGFSETDFVQAYDVAGPGEFSTYTDGVKMYYVAVEIDTSAIRGAYSIHFDLYNTTLKTSGKSAGDEYVANGSFAPFSHDAESRVPEPGTLYLLGSGLIGLGLLRRGKNVA